MSVQRASIRHRLLWLMKDVRRHGLRTLIDRYAPAMRREFNRKRAAAAAFDEQGYDTAGVAEPKEMTLVGEARPENNHYDATPSYDVEEALDKVGIGPEGVTFIDIGSGKGRVLLMAAARPFARIIGIEYATELHETARANVANYAARHGGGERIELQLGDAADFVFPDEPSIVFLFNTFGPPLLTRVIANLHASWRANPRPLRVIYENAVHAAQWPAGGFEEVALSSRQGFIIYAPRDAG